MKDQKGYTLLEVILAMAIGFMLIAIIWSILGLGVRSQSFSANEYEKQANMRYAIETINNRMRFFTVGFAVTEEHFQPEYSPSGELNGVVAPWNYIGLSPDKTHLVHYEYQDDGYVTTDLTLPVEDLDLDLRFQKESGPQEDNLLTLFLNGYENTQQTFNIKTTIDAINALQLIDWGDGTQDGSAVALAYRTDETPEIDKRPVAAMSMVLDTSGSMNWQVSGDEHGNPIDGDDASSDPSEHSRIRILRESLSLMIDDLSEEENAYVSLVPFHRNANIPHDNLSKASPENLEGFSILTNENKSEWENLVNQISANDGTNTGDGIRRGYYQLLDFNNNLNVYGLEEDQELSNYMVILVDGETTMASARVSRTYGWFSGYSYFYQQDFILDSNDIENNWISNAESRQTLPGTYLGRYTIGKGNELDPEGTEYVDLVGERLIQANNLPGGAQDLELDNNVFVIGFSDIEKDLGSVKDIAQSVGIAVSSDESDINNDFKDNDRVFIARDANDLEGVFKDISGYIVEDLWQVSGPRLEP
ncbi:Type IV pilin N-term methylation site GFxxxE [Pelagirhabdus alkalitolerans]|uniref:Type IV pilin N-term methylation site GFxxxE n=1 Tax=Pelagirhabdus alkalitolerans TaxID=1612202 RepID=A0A1G6HNN7_9BACI|nr:prepilin-type N-terminal cleavage/methylation domain-containing protein [Pelagirhabdus alkalitolerans]SDB95748.1 Type IV pilin N-term methylation site GFxxxE [Pelagirhabdus alkalitolerans]